MAISTRAELLTAIQTWMDRQDISGNTEDFLRLGESRLNRILPLRMTWTTTTLTGTAGSRSVALPADFVEPLALFLTTYGTQERLTPFVAGTIELNTGNGAPTGWCINGSNIDLDTICDQAHTFSFRYRQAFALSDADDDETNWLLTNHPDIYLFACLVEASFFAKNPEIGTATHQRLDLALSELAAKEGRSTAQAILMADPALSGPVGFNINTG